MAHCVIEVLARRSSGDNPIPVLALDTASQVPNCTSSLMVITNDDYNKFSSLSAIDPGLLGVDSASIASAFGWSFAVVILFWSMGFGLGVALGIIRKA